MSQILEAELRLVGSDKTAAAFAGVIKHAEELKRALAGAASFKLDDAGARERAAAIRQSTAALRAERIAAAEVTRAYAAGNEALTARATMMQRMAQRFPAFAQVAGMGWMAGGIASGRVAHSIAHSTANYAHQKALLESSTGMSRDEVDRAVDQAFRLRVPGISAADHLKAIGELRIVFNSTEHAIEHLAAVQRASAVMKALNPHMDAENESYNLARALELKGVSTDPEHFMRLTNKMVQAMNASRGKITGSEFFEFTKYARGAAGRLTDDFYTRVAPTLIQELGGHSAGMALSSFRQTLVGGKMTNKAAEEFVRLGLVDPRYVIHTKTGSVKGVRPGGLVDSALANQDPYAWIQGYLKPALTKAKITDPDKIAEELAHLFSNRFSEQMASILLNQSQRIEKDWKLIEEAPSTESLEKLRGTSPIFAAHDLSAAIDTLLSSLGNPMAQHAIATMNQMADGARYLAERYAHFAKSSPLGAELTATLGAAGLGYVGLKGVQATFGLMTGATALKGSAAALAQSAAALDAAAAKLGSVPSVGQSNGAVAPSSALGGIWGTLPGVSTALQLYSYMEEARAKAGKLSTASWEEWWYRQSGGRDDRDWLRLENAQPFTVQSIRGALAGDDPYRTAIGGSAEITNKVVVEPSPDFLTRVETMISNALHAITINGAPPTGTAGSTGGAMPEALPAGP